MVQDPDVAAFGDLESTEWFTIEREDILIDGPACRRLAVIDLDESGDLRPPAKFVPPEPGRKLGNYGVTPDTDAHDIDFVQVSAFGAVLKTLYMFEETETLGRPITWGFNHPQLLLVPRAGEWANAFYDRYSKSLQFFQFRAGGQDVFTALSRDIVCHETGHAILDGVAPDLYNASTPQALALHEAVADLTALLMAFRSGKLREQVLQHTSGSIADPTAFSSIAEQFGSALARPGHLRSLINSKNLDPDDPNFVPPTEPHELSEVLSGALYVVMMRMHDTMKKEMIEREHREPLAASGRALGLASERFKRMILRSLDYLPPGDVTFADYGRAIIAADRASHPDASREREWLSEEFVRRNIVPRREDLETEADPGVVELDDIDLTTLVESDWAAYDFVNAHRSLFELPAGVPFHVRPRLDVTKSYRHRDGERSVRECIIKVSWDQKEPTDAGPDLAPEAIVRVGTTLGIDWDGRNVRARLPSTLIDSVADAEHLDSQREDRSSFLRSLVERELIDTDPTRSLGDPTSTGKVQAPTSDGSMKLRGTARMLHVVEDTS